MAKGIAKEKRLANEYDLYVVLLQASPLGQSTGWRFREADDGAEFTASVVDDFFLAGFKNQVLKCKEGDRLYVKIYMEQTHKKDKTGAWVLRCKRAVKEVYRVIPAEEWDSYSTAVVADVRMVTNF